MKKILIIFVVFLCCLQLDAQPLNKQEALIRAEQFFGNRNRNSGLKRTQSVTPKLVLASNQEEFFIFNDETNGGYVIISGDERTPDVLGYSNYGHYDSKHVPCNMQAILNHYAQQITFLHAHPEYKIPGLRRSGGEAKVAPLLGETAWHQGWPYNNMCPAIDGKHCPTGCVATAAAQVMYYHKWPERGTGSVSYEWNGQTLSADFSQSEYRWDLMTPTYDSNSSKESCDAVALLMRDVGYSAQMDYGLGGSGANMVPLITYFDYDASMGEMFRDWCNAETWHEIILGELLEGRPVLYNAGQRDGLTEAHALLIDGYDGDGYFHFNFGWGPGNNGNYTMLSVFYNSGPSIFFGIKKNEGGKPRFFYGSNSDFIYVPEKDCFECKDMEIMGPTRAQELQYTALAIENIASHERIYTDERNQYQRLESEFLLTEILPDGDYIIYPVGRSEFDNEWQKYLFYDERQPYVDLNVTNGVKTYTNNYIANNIQNGAVEIDHIYYFLNKETHEATVTYKNDKYASYTGDVTIPATVNYNDQEYTVTEIGNSAFSLSNVGTLFIPRTVKSIASGGLRATFESVVFENGSQLESVAGWGFSGINTEEVSLPEGLSYLPNHTFEGALITRIYLPSTLQNLYGEVFSNCWSLRSFILNSSEPMVLDSSPFYGNLSSCSLYVPKGSAEKYSQADVWKDFGRIVEWGDTVTIDGIKYITDVTNGTADILSAYDLRFSGSVKFDLPSTIIFENKEYRVTYLSPFSLAHPDFREMQIPVREVTIPNTVESIGDCAFRTNENLEKVSIGNGVHKIGYMAFWGCNNLVSVSIGKGLTMIDDGFVNCYNLRDLYCHAVNVPKTGDEFFCYYDITTLHVPAESLEAYRTTAPWSNFVNIVALTEEETGIKTINNNLPEMHYYTIDGKRIGSPTKGVNVVRMSNGDIRKIIIK